MDSFSEFLLIANVASTWFMAGVIWYVQIVHYPLFSMVGLPGFSAYENSHSSRTTLVVAPPMLVEFSTSFLLLVFPPPGVGYSLLVVGVALVAVIWASTVLLQIPRHTKLGAGFETNSHRSLVLSNWIRTVAWTARAAILIWILTGVI